MTNKKSKKPHKKARRFLAQSNCPGCGFLWDENLSLQDEATCPLCQLKYEMTHTTMIKQKNRWSLSRLLTLARIEWKDLQSSTIDKHFSNKPYILRPNEERTLRKFVSQDSRKFHPLCIILGDEGVGKTSLMYSIGNKWLERGIPTFFVPQGESLDEYFKTTFLTKIEQFFHQLNKDKDNYSNFIKKQFEQAYKLPVADWTQPIVFIHDGYRQLSLDERKKIFKMINRYAEKIRIYFVLVSRISFWNTCSIKPTFQSVIDSNLYNELLIVGFDNLEIEAGQSKTSDLKEKKQINFSKLLDAISLSRQHYRKKTIFFPHLADQLDLTVKDVHNAVREALKANKLNASIDVSQNQQLSDDVLILEENWNTEYVEWSRQEERTEEVRKNWIEKATNVRLQIEHLINAYRSEVEDLLEKNDELLEKFKVLDKDYNELQEFESIWNDLWETILPDDYETSVLTEVKDAKNEQKNIIESTYKEIQRLREKLKDLMITYFSQLQETRQLVKILPFLKSITTYSFLGDQIQVCCINLVHHIGSDVKAKSLLISQIRKSKKNDERLALVEQLLQFTSITDKERKDLKDVRTRMTEKIKEDKSKAKHKDESSTKEEKTSPFKLIDQLMEMTSTPATGLKSALEILKPDEEDADSQIHDINFSFTKTKVETELDIVSEFQRSIPESKDNVISDIIIKEEKPVIAKEKPVIVEEETVIVEEKPVIVEEETVIVEEKPVIVEEKPVIAEEESVIVEEEKIEKHEEDKDYLIEQIKKLEQENNIPDKVVLLDKLLQLSLTETEREEWTKYQKDMMGSFEDWMNISISTSESDQTPPNPSEEENTGANTGSLFTDALSDLDAILMSVDKKEPADS